jgi:ectoine hydroxylase-related dioxygenase (phytanoyl-CoA dioxygenase family)
VPDRELDTPHELSDEQISHYREHGYVKLQQVLSPETLAEYGPEFTRVTREWSYRRFISEYEPEILQSVQKALGSGTKKGSDTYARAFTQRPNLWRFSAVVERFVRSPRLARIAAELMGVDGVRLYHDQALYKEPHGGHTPWHVDQFYWPLSNANTTTVWIPLQPVPAEMGPVAFARGSQNITVGHARELAISDESEARLGELMRDYEVDASAYELGEVSFHSGWTCHRADPNQTENVRAAFTIIYMDRDIRAIELQHANHVADSNMWLPGVKPGEVAASKLNPILYESRGSED